jgi:hypothetical protein
MLIGRTLGGLDKVYISIPVHSVAHPSSENLPLVVRYY